MPSSATASSNPKRPPDRMGQWAKVKCSPRFFGPETQERQKYLQNYPQNHPQNHLQNENDPRPFPSAYIPESPGQRPRTKPGSISPTPPRIWLARGNRDPRPLAIAKTRTHCAANAAPGWLLPTAAGSKAPVQSVIPPTADGGFRAAVARRCATDPH